MQTAREYQKKSKLKSFLIFILIFIFTTDIITHPHRFSFDAARTTQEHRKQQWLFQQIDFLHLHFLLHSHFLVQLQDFLILSFQLFLHSLCLSHHLPNSDINWSAARSFHPSPLSCLLQTPHLCLLRPSCILDHKVCIPLTMDLSQIKRSFDSYPEALLCCLCYATKHSKVFNRRLHSTPSLLWSHILNWRCWASIEHIECPIYSFWPETLRNIFLHK